MGNVSKRQQPGHRAITIPTGKPTILFIYTNRKTNDLNYIYKTENTYEPHQQTITTEDHMPDRYKQSQLV